MRKGTEEVRSGEVRPEVIVSGVWSITIRDRDSSGVRCCCAMLGDQGVELTTSIMVFALCVDTSFKWIRDDMSTNGVVSL